MPNIKPISDLRNYNEVLKDVSAGSPVFLTKNGRGKYASDRNNQNSGFTTKQSSYGSFHKLYC